MYRIVLSLFLPFYFFTFTAAHSQSKDWVEVRNEGMKFSSVFYEHPQIVLDTLDAASHLYSTTYELEVNDQQHPNAYYSLAITEFPSSEVHSDSTAMINDLLDATQLSLVEDNEMELVSIHHKAKKGYPGKEYRWSFRDQSGFLQYQVYLVKNRMYMLTVVTRANQNYNQAITKFFEGFRLEGIEKNPHAEKVAKAKKKFRIRFPGEVEKRTQRLESAYGMLYFFMQIHQPEKGTNDNLIYLAGYTEYPEEAAQEGEFEDKQAFYEKAINGTVQALQGKLVGQKAYGYKKYSGREYKVSLYNGQIIATYRCLLVDKTLYTYGVLTEHENLENAAKRKFFKSFKVKRKWW